MITANAVENISEKLIALLSARLPREDTVFNFSECLTRSKKIIFESDGVEVGALLYSVLECSDGGLALYVDAFALDMEAAGCGEDCFKFVCDEARKLGCRRVQMMSPRAGFLRYARKNNWRVAAVKYEKDL